MHDDSNIVFALKARQEAMRREIGRRHISLKVVAADAGMSYSTLLSYFPSEACAREPALMPVSAQYLLCMVLPADILSMLLPDDFAITKVNVGTDHDDFAAKCIELVTQTAAAHHPDSECKERIGPNESRALNGHRAALKIVA